jgi:4-amino-4-deoxy-L-arabinose transferase-like glycosyltransferase
MRALYQKVHDFFASRPGADYVVVGLAAGAVLFPMLGSQGLWDPCESHALEVAREAAAEGRWLPLHFDGQPLPGLPPLFFWLQGFWMILAGTGELGARLLMALLGLGWILFVVRSARPLLGRRAAFLLGMALSTCPFFFGSARHASPHLLAAMLAFGAVLSGARVLTSPKKTGRRIDELLPWIFGSAALLAGGAGSLLFVILSLGAVWVAGLARALEPPRLRRLWSLTGLLVMTVPAGIWILAELSASGPAFLSGFLDLQNLSFGAMREFGHEEVFTFHVVQAGHMLYPWFVLFPAALVWLATLAPRSRMDNGRRLLLVLFLGGPLLFLVAASFLPLYLPLDMVVVCPSLAALSVWGIVFASESEGVKENAVLLSFGALLVALGCGSLGVDFFWALKRPVEVIGYPFDRPYPELTAIAKVFYNAVAILTGLSTAILLLWRRRAMVIAWALCAAALAISLFIVHHVYRVCGPYFSAGQLIEAYEPEAREGDIIATYLMEPQSRGGDAYYFKGRALHLESRAALAEAMQNQAGTGRLILITSHVRDLYNDVFDLSCGIRVKPLNENRRWYAVCSYEGPPPTGPGETLIEGSEEPDIQFPSESVLLWQKKPAVTFLGYGMKNLDPKTRKVKRGGWIDVELFWRPETRLPGSWKIYLDAMALSKGKGSGSGHLSLHHVPGCGTMPTYRWPVGGLVRDFSRLFFSSDLDPGYYSIRAGLFSKKGERMMVEAPAGSVKTVPRSTITLTTVLVE